MRIATALLLFPCCLPAADLTPMKLSKEGDRWWSHIQVLADDKMEGRNTGSDGYMRAARYVAGEFERAGLKPAGTNGYFQPVKFSVTKIDESKSSLELVRNGRATPILLGPDAALSVRPGLANHVEAEAVFCGYGMVIPEYKIDDLAGLDLKGKIIVYMGGGDASVPSEMRAHYSSGGERAKAYRKAGAIGTITIANPKSMDIPWERSTLARLSATMSLANRDDDESKGLVFGARMNPASANKLLAGSGHKFEELLALADANKPLPHFPLNLTVRATETLEETTVESPNVIGVLPGTDPKLRHEYVVYSAHLDHLGIGGAVNGDTIYNGAMDDGSGIASILEIATMLKEQKVKLKRSVLFMAAVAEEKGELGSKAFADHPTVPQQNLVADINIDMFLPLFPLKVLEVQGVNESTLGADIREAAKKAGVAVQSDKEPDRNLFIRSDQYSYVQQGVPALAFKFGYEFGTPEEKIALAWRRERYHAPSDDLNQPVDKPAAALFDRILMDTGIHVANTPERPHWLPTSFFKRFEKN
jgi:Peptidase family M28